MLDIRRIGRDIRGEELRCGLGVDEVVVVKEKREDRGFAKEAADEGGMAVAGEVMAELMARMECVGAA